MNIQNNKKAVLDLGKTVGPQVYQILHDQIVQGKVVPGTRFSEAEISRKFNTSRQPVREAFIKLRNEGLVEIRPQRGTFVTKIWIDAVGDARFIREAIEADIVKLLARESNPQLVTLLREQILQQRNLAPSEGGRFLELDEQFHRTLAECAQKAIAWKVIASMKAHLDRVRHLSSIQKPLKNLIDQHEEIVDAIEAKDSIKAEKAIRYHMQEVLRDLPEIVAKHPELFRKDNMTKDAVNGVM